MHELLAAVLLLAPPADSKGAAAPMKDASSVHSFTARTIDGQEKPLTAYKGKGLLIVNTASECGFTPQYAPLQKLYESYRDRGFTVLAFPSNDFGAQEPGSNADIKKFCSTKFHTTFDLFEKIPVKGPTAHPLYKYLTTLPGFAGEIKWNFNKFLVDPDGRVVARFDSDVDPMSETLRKKVEDVLPKK